jgi:hypothetical protein
MHIASALAITSVLGALAGVVAVYAVGNPLETTSVARSVVVSFQRCSPRARPLLSSPPRASPHGGDDGDRVDVVRGRPRGHRRSPGCLRAAWPATRTTDRTAPGPSPGHQSGARTQPRSRYPASTGCLCRTRGLPARARSAPCNQPPSGQCFASKTCSFRSGVAVSNRRNAAIRPESPDSDASLAMSRRRRRRLPFRRYEPRTPARSTGPTSGAAEQPE